MNTKQIARQAFLRHQALHSLADYRGILSLHAYARLALISAQSGGDEDLLAHSRALLLPFVRGERECRGANFNNYCCGGNGTAYLLYQGRLPEAEAAVRRYAEGLLHNAPRDENGVFCHPQYPGEGRIWIDVAFAVTPFLLFAGLALGQEAYVEEAIDQTLAMCALLRDPTVGLLHQCKNFRGPGLLSEDHWSRGNGWGLLALSELVGYLPREHPRRGEVERAFVDLVQACLRVQDAQGMWHQELTDANSYVETSGTGLILYAVGVGLEQGLLPSETQQAFSAGLRGYLAYIRPDGSVYHTCRGCLCPGQGRILDYEARAPVLNDPHAFGPVTLAFGQALRLGIVGRQMEGIE
jgi:unsaturated rhamnogalacturonyl hydrolase